MLQLVVTMLQLAVAVIKPHFTSKGISNSLKILISAFDKIISVQIKTYFAPFGENYLYK
jgi:hypothetical protein